MGKTNGKKLMTVHKHPSVIKKQTYHTKKVQPTWNAKKNVDWFLYNTRLHRKVFPNRVYVTDSNNNHELILS